MTELALIFAGGLLGSSHCVGMCGPLALAVGGSSPTWHANLSRQLVYSAGRIFTYAVIGGVAGYAGMRLSASVVSLVNAQALLAVFAGVLLIAQGLISAGVVVLPTRSLYRAGCPSLGLLGTTLRERTLNGALLAGIVTGFLPCGLVYAYVAMAASTNSLSGGLATMAVFGAGTVPLLVATGLSGTFLNAHTRLRAVRAAAWLVVLTGAISILRGTGYLDFAGGELQSRCPFCE